MYFVAILKFITACLRYLNDLATALRLKFLDKDIKDYFLDLIRSNKDRVFVIGINGTHLLVSEHLLGYGICSNYSIEDSNSELKKIIQGKFFNHLSTICRHLLVSFTRRSMKLQKAFLYLWFKNQAAL